MKTKQVTAWPQGKPAVKKASFSRRDDLRPLEGESRETVRARGKACARTTFMGNSLPFSEEDCTNW